MNVWSGLDLTIGTGGYNVLRHRGGHTTYLAHVPRPTYLTRAGGRLYGVSEIGHGEVFRLDGEAIPSPAPGAVTIGGLDGVPLTDGLVSPPIPSGGAHPCHISAAPDGAWLYVANYGDGTVRAIDVAAGEFGERIDLRHTGSGPDPSRQRGPHAHFTAVVGNHLVIADLGTDALRVHELTAGRPHPRAHLVALPPGSGPRHFAQVGADLIVAGELDGTLTRVRTGTWIPQAPMPAATAPGTHALSHIAAAGEFIIVAVRGANTLSVLDATLRIRQEVPTVGWPRHFALSREPSGVVVAGERSDRIAFHPFDPVTGHLGEATSELKVPEPMFVAVGEEF